jgi:hypothetical protein
MGLLDDAIREHLELKRRHGADPSEVERQEQEALGPARRGAAPPPEAEADAGGVSVGTLDEDEEREAPIDEYEDELGAYEDEPADYADEPADYEDEPQRSVPTGEPEAPVAPPAPAPEDRDPVEDPSPEPQTTEDPREDVLEETPEFLQETPEHDRLWFEQKPPRDFEF